MTLLTFPKKFQVADVLAKGNVLLVKDPNSGVYLKRHPNDLKRLNKDITFDEEKNKKQEYEMSCGKQLLIIFCFILYFAIECNNEIVNSQPKLRRSQHIRKPNPMYSIQIMYNEIASELSWLWG